jgi:hypothetical protein
MPVTDSNGVETCGVLKVFLENVILDAAPYTSMPNVRL